MKNSLHVIILIILAGTFTFKNVYAQEGQYADTWYNHNEKNFFQTSTSGEWAGGLAGLAAGFGMVFLLYLY